MFQDDHWYIEEKYYIQLIHCQDTLHCLDNWNKPKKHSVHGTGPKEGRESPPQVSFSSSSDLCRNEICNVNANRFLWGSLNTLLWMLQITSLALYLHFRFNYCRSVFFVLLLWSSLYREDRNAPLWSQCVRITSSLLTRDFWFCKISSNLCFELEEYSSSLPLLAQSFFKFYPEK